MRILKKLFIPLCLACCMALGISACDKSNDPTDNSSSVDSSSEQIVTYTLNVTADKTTALRGDVVTLAAYRLSSEGEQTLLSNAVFSIVEGSSIATISGDKVTVSQNAVSGDVIKVKAKVDATDSNIVEIKVSVPLEGIEISANGVTNVKSGNSVVLSKTVMPTGADESNLTWAVTADSEEYYTLNGDVLVISESAPTGAVIKVKAVSGEIESDELSFTVGYPLETLTLTPPTVTNILNNGSVVLNVTKLPANTTNGEYKWVVTADDEDYYSMSGDVLTVTDKAPTGAIIKVKAVALADETITTAEYSFTVGYPLETLTLTPPTVTNILNNSSVVLNVTKLPANTTNGEYKWVVTADDEDYYSMSGDVLTVTDKAPTGAIIKVKAVALADESITTAEYSFTVGYPLETLTINASGSTNIPNGKSVELTVSKFPENATNGDYKWEFVSGAEYCTFDEATGRLTVNEDAPLHKTITLKVVGTVATSVEDTIDFLVGISLEDLSISSTAPEILTHGESYDITLTPTPEDASTLAVRWVISQPAWASVENGKLIISETAPHGGTFTVHAESGNITSEKLSFQIGIALTSLTAKFDGVADGETLCLNPGEYKHLTVTRMPENTTDTAYVWEIAEEDRAYAKIENDTLFIDKNAPIGETVTFYAVNGDVRSEEIEVIIGTPIKAISISADKTEILQGDSTTLSVTLDPTNANFPYEWVVTADNESDYSLNGNVLTVSATAVTGSTITVKAVSGNVESNVIELTVGIPIEKITISAETTEIVKGESVTLSAVLEPANANFPYEWVVTAASESYYSLDGDVLTVSTSAITNAIITVKAVSGDVESENELTFTVLPTEEELNQGKYFIMVADEITLDKNGAANPVVEVEVIDGNFNEVTDKEVVFTVISGAEYLDITPNGMYCNLTPKGHGKAEIQVSLLGTSVVETVSVDVIVPPAALSLPEMFAQRTDIQYAYSMYRHNIAGEVDGKEALPFVATVDILGSNTNPCREIKYLFEHANGTMGDEVATYADGKITFHQTGVITVTASSDSGSAVETTVSYTFNINDGFNVYNFESAAALIDQKYYDGQQVNFVALEKPVGAYDDPNDPTYGYTYGYDFVPSTALKKHSDQTFLDVVNADKNRIIAVNQSVYINGNNHALDASQIRILTDSEISAGNTEYGREFLNHGGLISAEPWTTEGPEVNDVTGQFFVKIYNLDVKGAATINYENKENPGTFTGAYQAGINIGTHAYSATYSIDIQNVSATGFRYGMKMSNVYEGSLKDSYAYNCYQNGFMFHASIMTVENLKLGPCGAVGIELAPENSNTAGIDHNQSQTITFKGEIDAIDNYITLNTSYLNEYEPIPGMVTSVDSLVNTSISVNGFTDDQLAHFMEKVEIEGADAVVNKICMITFMLAGTVQNQSQAIYADAEGGIIDATALPTEGFDTTHQFIRLTVYATQGMPLGQVLVYNLKYQPSTNA